MQNTLLRFCLGRIVGVARVWTPFAEGTPPSLQVLAVTDGPEATRDAAEGMEAPDDLVFTDGQEEAPIDDADSSAVIGEDMSSANSANTSLWGIFLAGIAGGFIAFFMPCIFPMVPLTVSFFTKKSGSKAQAVSQA